MTFRLACARSFYRQFATSGVAWAPPSRKSSFEALTISYIMPGMNNDLEIEKETFSSPKSFTSCFSGFRFMNPKSGLTYSPSELLADQIDPKTVYIAKHYFLPSRLDEISPNQISDKAFEERACKTLGDYLEDRFYVSRRVSEDDCRPNAWRTLTKDDGRDFAEWEGIWEGPEGDFYFLEAKHYMDFGKISSILTKFQRSIFFLGLKKSQATLYLAGNYWKPDVAERAQELQTLYGFGILTPSGKDLIVTDPPAPAV